MMIIQYDIIIIYTGWHNDHVQPNAIIQYQWVYSNFDFFEFLNDIL